MLIGTSDIPIEDPEEARCTDEEVEYFLGLTRRVFPSLNLSRDQIVFRFSGVRPLPRSNAKNASTITRDHSIEVLGGDWTKYSDEHYEIIERFGRFPHRNPQLGRTSTAEELTFLADGGFAG